MVVSVGSGVLPCKVVIVDPVYRVNKRERVGKRSREGERESEQCRQYCYMYLNYMYLNHSVLVWLYMYVLI